MLIPTPELTAVLNHGPVPAQSASITTRLEAILAEEASLDVGQLNSDVSFVELGVDSLLSMTISSREQDELGLVIPPSTFADLITLNDVVDHFAPSERAIIRCLRRPKTAI